jgi:hypothetical protein
MKENKCECINSAYSRGWLYCPWCGGVLPREEITEESSVDVLDIPFSFYKALIKLNIEKIKDLRKLDKLDFYLCKGIGRKRINVLECILKENNLALKEMTEERKIIYETI